MQRVVTYDHIMYTVFPNIVSAEIQRSQYIRPKVIVHKGAETIQGRKLIKGRDYMRIYGICTCASAKALQKIGHITKIKFQNKAFFILKILNKRI